MRAFLVALLCVPSLAFAWGFEGHRIVAEIAEAHLTPSTKREVKALLALDGAQKLSDISTWADETKNKTSARWHYVNLPRNASCKYDQARDCADGECIVEALKEQFHLYRASASPNARLKALRYLVHLVADIHQPLHAAFGDDRGGNRFQVNIDGKGSNLHRVWDVELVRGKSVAIKAVQADTRFRPERWAEESCEIVSNPAFYPAHKLPASYLKRYAPVAEERLVTAGIRLAALLND